MSLRILTLTLGLACGAIAQVPADPDHWDKSSVRINVPFLEKAPVIDGDLSEWKYRAFTDGVWDIFRIANSPWYDPKRNRLTDHGNEPPPEDDLNARYYMAWDNRYLYLGAEVHDNVNDVTDPHHEPKRWYYKDAICWFIEAPHQARSDNFGRGDNAFCFVIDARKPSYGAWWRHGTATRALHRRTDSAAGGQLRDSHEPVARKCRRLYPGSASRNGSDLCKERSRLETSAYRRSVRIGDCPHRSRRGRLRRPPDHLRHGRQLRDLGSHEIDRPENAHRAQARVNHSGNPKHKMLGPAATATYWRPPARKVIGEARQLCPSPSAFDAFV